MPRTNDFVLLILLLVIATLGSACSSQDDTGEAPQAVPETTDVRRVCERIVEVLPQESGVTIVHFERSSLRYRIDPAASPNAAELVEFAERARDDAREVCALVDRSTIPATKDPSLFDSPPPLIVGFE